MKRDSTYAKLRDLILAECSPEQALLEGELANRLGVSRTPVREALSRLERDGLVRIVPRRGAFVTALTMQEIRELFEVREALELYALRRAAGHLDHRRLDRIQAEADAILSHLAPTLTPEAKYEALSDIFNDLHDVILSALGNSRLTSLLESVRGIWLFARKALARRITEEDVARTYEEHARIIEALRADDVAGAEQRMQLHLERSRQRFLAAVGH